MSSQKSSRNYKKNAAAYGTGPDRNCADNTRDMPIYAESLQTDTTLNEISENLKPGETLILDIGNNYFNQADEIYDTLVMRGYDVKKSVKNGRNQILVSKKP
ncbi:MAG: hypothetical protein ACM3XR_06925 [Bacillota bacterium]